MKFPDIDNHATPIRRGNSLTFSYVDSWSKPVTETRPVLTPDQVVQLVKHRMRRFKSAPPGARESDRARADRKYLAAQPAHILKLAFSKMNADQQSEFSTMLDAVSYSGISDPRWVQRQHATTVVVGDDGEALYKPHSEQRRALFASVKVK